MAKRIVGRTQIEVIDSIPYSQLVFLVASGKSYALTIAEARGKKDSSPTAKQLKQLEARGFLKSQKEKLLNKTIYSVNWNKILDEFFLFLKERKEGFIDSHNRLKTNVSPEILERLKLLDNKDFVKDMKANKYLNQFLKEYLSSIRDRSCSLYEAFAYFLVYVSFDFIYSTNPNLYYILSLGEGTNSFKIEEKERKKERKDDGESHIHLACDAFPVRFFPLFPFHPFSSFFPWRPLEIAYTARTWRPIRGNLSLNPLRRILPSFLLQ